MDLTNREIAFLAWLIAFVLWALTLRGVLGRVGSMLRLLSGPKLAIPLVLFAAYCAGVVWLGSRTGFWRLDLLKDTIAWFAVAGLVLFGRFLDVGKPRFVRGTVLRTIAVSELVQYALGTVSFSLIVELMLLPLAALLGVMSVVAGIKAGHRPAKRLVDGAISVLGLVLIVSTTIALVLTWPSLEHQELLLGFYMPIWLTTAAIPFVFAMGVYAQYESAFVRINVLRAGGEPLGVRRKLAVVVGMRGSVEPLSELVWKRGSELRQAGSFGEAVRIAQEARSGPIEAPK